MVTLVTKGTDPDLSIEIDARERIENGRASFTAEWSVRKRGNIWMRSNRRNTGGEWDHTLAGFDFGARPDVPGHSNSIDSFRICVRHLRHF